MTSTNVTDFQKNITQILRNTIEYNDVVNVSTNEGNAVLMSEDEYNGIIATLELNSESKVKEEILNGMEEDLTDCIPEEEVEW